MLQTTEGIILRTINYTGSSIIAKIYTQSFGLQSYLIKGARNKKSKVRANLLQPMTMLQLVVAHNSRNNFHTIYELQCNKPYHTLPFNVVKNSILIFINEVLYKSIKEEESNQNLFDFIQHSLQMLDLKESNYANFHLLFLLQLTRYLGFYPRGKYSAATPIFNLQEGTFVATPPVHPYYMEPASGKYLSGLFDLNFDTLVNSVVPASARPEFLKILLMYYELHVSGFRDVRSHTVLEEVMR